MEKVLKSKDFYKEKIIEMVKGIDNQKSINLVYGFVNRIYGEDRARE